MIKLRPHHLLCTQGYSGKGYDNDFVSNMDKVVHTLRTEPGTKIKLEFYTDDLCADCPNKLGENLCKSQSKVDHFDGKTVEYFHLEEKEYLYQEIIDEIDSQMTEEMLEEICGNCEWFAISSCKKNICKKI